MADKDNNNSNPMYECNDCNSLINNIPNWEGITELIEPDKLIFPNFTEVPKFDGFTQFSGIPALIRTPLGALPNLDTELEIGGLDEYIINNKLDIKDFTDGEVIEKVKKGTSIPRLTWEGSKVFDVMVNALNENLRVKFENGNVSADKYAEIYAQSLVQVLQIATEFMKYDVSQLINAKIEIKRFYLEYWKTIATMQMEQWKTITQFDLEEWRTKSQFSIEEWRTLSQFDLEEWKTIAQFKFEELKSKAQFNLEEWKTNTTYSLQKWQTENQLSLEVYKSKTQTEQIRGQLMLDCCKTKAQLAQMKAQARVLDRQLIGFDDNMYIKLLEYQLNSFSMIYSSGMLDDAQLPDPLNKNELGSLYSAYRNRIDKILPELLSSEKAIADESLYLP